MFLNLPTTPLPEIQTTNNATNPNPLPRLPKKTQPRPRPPLAVPQRPPETRLEGQPRGEEAKRQVPAGHGEEPEGSGEKNINACEAKQRSKRNTES